MTWTSLSPPLQATNSSNLFAGFARNLSRLKPKAEDDDEVEDLVENMRREFVEQLREWPSIDRQILVAAGLVLSDLVAQGWPIRIRRGAVYVKPPEEVVGDRAAEKQRVRRQELLKRDAQLRQPAVQKFVRSIEHVRLHHGRFVSIFSLMRDGRELADAIRNARVHSNNSWEEALASVVDPYIQFVKSKDARCPNTGIRLMHIWRYFRHTWTNQYTSVPGRSMQFIVRDRAAPFHPVIGIGAISSPVMQIRERDMWIGWHPDAFLAEIRASPIKEIAIWLVQIVDAAIQEIYVDDFIEDELVSVAHLQDPTEEVIERLLHESAEQRRLHHRFVRSRDHKQARQLDTDHWVGRARTHLFKSKRAIALAEFMRARALFKRCFGARPTAEKLGQLISTTSGSNVIRKVLRKVKAERLGIAVADISVCGAVQPYNPILGGKLVAMLAASPEVVMEYRRRYSEAESEIASAMAGRPVIRQSNLVLLGTTSLYGTGSSQYNRIKIPYGDDVIRFEKLGYSEAFGTSQYSEETVEALVSLVHQSANGQRVNSIFGEGASPKLRKVRDGLDRLDFPSDLLLRHHRRRVVYSVSLVRNLRGYLLGMEATPDYLISPEDEAAATSRIAAWWRVRWLRKRIQSDAVVEQVSRHTLVRPVTHGARVPLGSDTPDRQAHFDNTAL